MKTLKESTATWKIIISPTPMVGPDRNSKNDNHANLNGFRYEADEFFAWIQKEKISNVMTFCGDRHWQYYSIHPTGFEEFGCGALNDENSIRGTKPGAKGSTDPEGKIKQPYSYDKPTGGFIHVAFAMKNNLPELTISHYDDEGKKMNSVIKTLKQ